MKIYFVRHGLYKTTTPPTFPQDNIPLAAQGIKQVKTLVPYFKDKKFEKIITSPATRARETATILKNFLEIDITESELFQERKRPSEIVGKPLDDSKAKEINQIIKANYHNTNFRYSDEENYSDLKTRAEEAIDYLVKQQNQKVCVITHAEILAMILSYMMLRKDFTSEMYINIRDFLFIGLATPIVVEYKNNGWRLMQWNIGLDKFLDS